MNAHVQQSESDSGAYRRDRRSLLNWVLAVIGAALVGVVLMVLKHETQLAVIGEDSSRTRADVQEIKSDLKMLLRRTP